MIDRQSRADMEDHDCARIVYSLLRDFLKSVPDSKASVSTVRRLIEIISFLAVGSDKVLATRYLVIRGMQLYGRSLRVFLSEASAEESLEQFDIGPLQKNKYDEL